MDRIQKLVAEGKRTMTKNKVEITVKFEIDDDFYVGERLSKKERERLYEENFSDIEVLVNHIPRSCYSVEAKIFKEGEDADL